MAKKPETPKKGVKPRDTSYDPEVAATICELLSQGVPLRQICRMEGMPAWRNVYFWMERDEELAAHIARAREIGQEAMAEKAYLEMYDEPERILSEGGGKIDPGYVQLVKARAEITLKLLAKWNPKRYGDRVALTGADNAPPIQVESKLLFDAVLQNLESKRQVE